MINADYTLELCNVFHTGVVEPGTCFQRMMGNVKTGIILKDVSLEVHGGEVLAVLGSKGSGKRALLEVVARRAQGPTRGQLLLNGAPMTLRLFQQSCGYVTHKCDLLPGLSVEQTLYHAAQLALGTKVSRHLKRSRVRQVMADLALSQVANRATEQLTQSEYRRLAIGVQLVRDPVILLLDEPTWDLDPLNTYLVVSILSNHARKYGRAVVLTMEKPRSDVFPFLDRVTYLCLGEVVYTGGTRLMLDYFRSIGFPCPELENPLMYYLCLSTVDRRSRERFIESNHQIAALVEKFKMEGGPFRKTSAILSGRTVVDPPDPLHAGGAIGSNKVPLSAFGRPGAFHVSLTLFFTSILSFVAVDLLQGNGVPSHRTRYYQEAQEGLYSGPLFILSYLLFSLPFSLISMAAASRITFELTGLQDPVEWLKFGGILWACHLMAEQLTIALLMVVKSSFTAAVTSIYIHIVILLLGSGTLRSIRGLLEWLYYLTYATQSRYAGATLAQQMFDKRFVTLPKDVFHNCTSAFQGPSDLITGTSPSFGCRYANGNAFLIERYGREDADDSLTEFLDFNLNFGITFAFSVGFILFNCLLYVVPLPAAVKAKFRE
ncbi:Protein brown [Gryllus bimaculatus]|nr:Protein brown [Gryllus bimaculatus]